LIGELLPIKKRYILKLLFKSRKGLFQAKEYNKKAKEFWKNKQTMFTEEIRKILNSNTDLQLAKLSKDFVRETGFKELICSVDEIHEFKMLLNVPDKTFLINDFVNYATRTGFLTVVIAPALAAADGLGDIREEVMDEWLYGIGICLPVSADVIDSIMDKEVMKHPKVPERRWVACHKLCAAIIFQIGMDHINNIKTGDEGLNKRIINRLSKGVKKVCEKQKMDSEVKNSTYVDIKTLEEIYDGKICEIEATVFGTLPSNKTDIVRIFEEGAHFFAGELQVVDDFEDLLGDTNLQKKPEIPNPSFFLTHCIDLWKSGRMDMEEVIKEAARKSWERGQEYHDEVVNAFNRLPKDFKTKPFFEVTLWYYNKVLKDRFNQFLKGKTYPEIKNQLLNIVKK
jgi:hypothetical protein